MSPLLPFLSPKLSVLLYVYRLCACVFVCVIECPYWAEVNLNPSWLSWCIFLFLQSVRHIVFVHLQLFSVRVKLWSTGHESDLMWQCEKEDQRLTSSCWWMLIRNITFLCEFLRKLELIRKTVFFSVASADLQDEVTSLYRSLMRGTTI